MSKLKALSFLGLGPSGGYQETTYLKHDGSMSWKTHLFQEAVIQLYKPKELVIFATSEVLKDEKGYLEYLKGKFKVDIKPIPDGRSTDELWQIFDVYKNVVDEGDEIILDITHAFRSLPLLVFTAAAYLRQVKDVELEHIIYGAFEARDPDKNETPIFDLTLFVELLNWTNAVNVFQLTGDARQIAALDIHSDIRDALKKLSEISIYKSDY